MVSLHIYHHGEFDFDNTRYIGGCVNVMENMDPDLLSFRDLEDFAKSYNYDLRSSVAYFKINGNCFGGGIRKVYDDKSVFEMIEACLPYGKIEIFIKHLVDNGLADDDSKDDPNYVQNSSGTGSESYENNVVDECDNIVDSDEEFTQIRIEADLCKLGKRVGAHHEPKEIKSYNSSDESAFDSDDLRSVGTSSEDENAKQGYIGCTAGKKKKKNVSKVYKANKNKEGIKFKVGMKFISMKEFRAAVREYGMTERRGIYFVTNDADRVQVFCQEKCPFYIWVSRIENSEAVQIRNMVDEHQCTKPYTNTLATVKYLTQLYGERIRSNPQWKIKDMIEVIKKEMEIEIPKIKCIRIRKRALEGVYDALKEQYGRLRDLGHELLKLNSNNTVKIATTRLNEDDEGRFQRFYICYNALKMGWRLGCRPILGLDGCFLKTVCGGQLIAAVGRDGNNQMFPIAYAIVESECTDSWRWYIELLIEDLDLGDGLILSFTIMTNMIPNDFE